MLWLSDRLVPTFVHSTMTTAGISLAIKWSALFSRLGVQHRYTMWNRPQQNGVAEHANCTIVEAIAAALTESVLPHLFWAECLASFIHV